MWLIVCPRVDEILKRPPFIDTGADTSLLNTLTIEFLFEMGCNKMSLVSTSNFPLFWHIFGTLVLHNKTQVFNLKDTCYLV